MHAHPDVTLTKEVLDVVQNDISRPDTLQIVEPEIEEQLHYESTYDENRLNEDDDVVNISMLKPFTPSSLTEINNSNPLHPL